MRRRISVAMATYNGEKYIEEQLKSILCQLSCTDEIIISDDGSKDHTIEIIKKMDDDRIKLLRGPGKGVKKNFENALKKCTGQYVFLSDQDDVWIDNKVDIVLNTFANNPKCTCVLHDCSVFDEKCDKVLNPSFYMFRNTRVGILKNLIKNSYIGCCMAFDSSLIKYIIPIPNEIEMHDQWIGMLSEIYGENIMITDKLIKYRRHLENVSDMKHHPLMIMIKNRIFLIKNLISIVHRIYKEKKDG